MSVNTIIQHQSLTAPCATHGPAAMRVNLASYELTGIFADPTIGNWNNFDGLADSARVGAASVSTWQIGTLHDAQATGSIKIKGDRHWAHIDVNDIKGMVVDIQIHDRDATSNCGFIAFDHFYQSTTSRGQQAATATRPVTR